MLFYSDFGLLVYFYIFSFLLWCVLEVKEVTTSMLKVT